MAGHPPVIKSEQRNKKLTLRYNLCNSVPFSAVKRAIAALTRAKLLPAGTTVALVEVKVKNVQKTMIEIVVPRPMEISAQPNAKNNVQWVEKLQTIVHTMNICIQSRNGSLQIVKRARTVSDAA